MVAGIGGTTQVVPFPVAAGGVTFDSRAALLDLPEDPGIRGRGSSDHHRVATSLRDHGAGVLRRADIAIADDGDLHRVFDRGNPLPARVAAVTLLTRARMERNGCEATGFRHAGQFHA